MREQKSGDRRVRRTRSLLHRAIASLIHEKPYEEIGVKEILARADVGRSTFYAHFRDKNELLDSGIRDMLHASGPAAPARTVAPADRVLRFSRPLFEHIERERLAGARVVEVKEQAVVHERLKGLLAEMVDEELRRVGRGGAARGGEVPRDLLVSHVAATFVLVLEWWIERAERVTAREADELFRALVLPIMNPALGRGLTE